MIFTKVVVNQTCSLATQDRRWHCSLAIINEWLSDKGNLTEMLKPFFPNDADIALEDLQSIPELRRLLADGSIVGARFVPVAVVDSKIFLPLPQKQILGRLFVAFWSWNFRFQRVKDCLDLGGNVAFGNFSRALTLVRIAIESFLLSIRGESLVFFSCFVDLGLKHLLVLDQIPRGVIEGSMSWMRMDPEAGGVNYFPLVIQSG